jgi:hypothetical protein
VPIKLTPMRSTTGPVTSGGKAFWSAFGGIKLSAISRRAQTHAVPRIDPYPSGHGSFAPEASTGHVPLAYHCAKAPVATGIVANDVPTTLSLAATFKNFEPDKTRA